MCVSDVRDQQNTMHNTEEQKSKAKYRTRLSVFRVKDEIIVDARTACSIGMFTSSQLARTFCSHEIQHCSVHVPLDAGALI